MTKPFPETPDFAGYNAPSRIECEIYDLVIEGAVPQEIKGSWYRAVPDPQYPPLLGDDTYLSGDGMVSLFRFEDGHVDFRQRYVRTERWKRERAARRALYGAYRSPYTDDPSVRGLPGRSTANTTPVWHAGKLLAVKEDGRPIRLDPETLETLGEYDFDGALRSQTMTAHTRIDPATGEMFFYGYEAAGLASRDIAYCIADAQGRLVKEEWFEAPYAALVHDFVVTREHAIFPIFPITADRARLEAGGPHWVWDPTLPTHVGIMPRYGSVKEMRWFQGPARTGFHFMNAYTEGDLVHVDTDAGTVPVFRFIQEASGLTVRPEDMRGGLSRWTFDLSKNDDSWTERPLGPGGNMFTVAERDAMVDYRIGYYQLIDLTAGPPLIAGPVGPGFNTICRIDVKTGETRTWSPGPRATVQEQVHVPSRIPGHEGYLLFIADLHDRNLSDAIILEAEHPERGPVARLKLPLRLRVGVHGSWAPA